MDSAWQYILERGGVSLDDLRMLNCDTAIPWTIGLLLAVMDAGFVLDEPVSIRAVVDIGESLVSDVLLIVSGPTFAEVRETDSGDFVVSNRRGPIPHFAGR